MEFALAPGHRQIVEAGDAPAQQPVLVELPVLVALAAEPVAGIVAPLIGEARGDAFGRAMAGKSFRVLNLPPR